MLRIQMLDYTSINKYLILGGYRVNMVYALVCFVSIAPIANHAVSLANDLCERGI
jgi:hypothetical protein